MSEDKPADSGDNDQQPSKLKLSRREALKGMGALGLTGLFGLKACEEAGSGGFQRSSSLPDQPNILFVMTDDHAVNALSCYGGRLMETPNLDRLAEGGMRFNNCYVTNSLCAPSRATILTGKYSHKHGVRENLFGDKPPFDGSQQTFPKLLRQAGYRTSMIGKWHLKSDPTGFDYWNVLPGQGRYNNPDLIEMGERKNYEGYVTDVITDLTIERLEKRRQAEDGPPFCMFSWHKAPHRGWVPEEDHEDMFSDYDLPVPPTFNDDYMNRSSAAEHAYMNIATMPDWRDEQPEGMTEEETAHWNYQRYIKNYLRVIKSFDENMGRLLDYLEESGLAENTIVVYTTDNGFFLGEHGWFDKRFMYEESIRVPLLVRYPGAVRPGSVNENVVMNLDLAETFLDYAGVEIPADMQGKSLRPLLREEADEGIREVIYYHYYEYPGPHDVRPHYGVRSDRYKLIYFYTIDEWELFDLEDDPWELNSVHGAPAYAEVQKEMEALLKQARQEHEDDTGEPLPY